MKYIRRKPEDFPMIESAHWFWRGNVDSLELIWNRVCFGYGGECSYIAVVYMIIKQRGKLLFTRQTTKPVCIYRRKEIDHSIQL